MEQKEAELENEISGPPQELSPRPEVAAGETASAPEPAPKPEERQALLPLASGVGRRLKRRPAHPVVTPAQGETEDEGENEVKEGTGEAEGRDDYPLVAWRGRTPENRGLGRGGLAAVVLLVIFVPLFVFFLYLLYTNTERIDAMRQNLADFNGNGAVAAASGTVSAESGLVQMLNRGGVQMYPLKVEDLSPSGRVVFYTDNTTLAFTYGNLDPVDADQVYTIWLSTGPAGSSGASFVRLANLPNNHSTGSALLVNPAALPANFKLANYAEMVVTVEKVDQKNARPEGPRAFSLDLTGLKK